MEKRRLNNKGFTLVEMLVVVAIIAILVGIVISAIGMKIEKAREITDLANVRNAYSAVVQAYMLDDKSGDAYSDENGFYKEVQLVQTSPNWDTIEEEDRIIAGICYGDTRWKNEPLAGGTAKIFYSADDKDIAIDWGGEAKVTNTPQYNFGKTSGVGQWVLAELKTQLENKSSDSSSIFNKGKDSSSVQTMTLPNGQTVTVNVFNRDYNNFDDVKNRLTAGTASAIYNVTTGKISTIIYYDGKNYSSWSINDDESGTENWKDDSYVKKNGTTVGANG